MHTEIAGISPVPDSVFDQHRPRDFQSVRAERSRNTTARSLEGIIHAPNDGSRKRKRHSSLMAVARNFGDVNSLVQSKITVDTLQNFGGSSLSLDSAAPCYLSIIPWRSPLEFELWLGKISELISSASHAG